MKPGVLSFIMTIFYGYCFSIAYSYDIIIGIIFLCGGIYQVSWGIYFRNKYLTSHNAPNQNHSPIGMEEGGVAQNNSLSSSKDANQEEKKDGR